MWKLDAYALYSHIHNAWTQILNHSRKHVQKFICYTILIAFHFDFTSSFVSAHRWAEQHTLSLHHTGVKATHTHIRVQTKGALEKCLKMLIFESKIYTKQMVDSRILEWVFFSSLSSCASINWVIKIYLTVLLNTLYSNIYMHAYLYLILKVIWSLPIFLYEKEKNENISENIALIVCEDISIFIFKRKYIEIYVEITWMMTPKDIFVN